MTPAGAIHPPRRPCWRPCWRPNLQTNRLHHSQQDDHHHHHGLFRHGNYPFKHPRLLLLVLLAPLLLLLLLPGGARAQTSSADSNPSPEPPALVTTPALPPYQPGAEVPGWAPGPAPAPAPANSSSDGRPELDPLVETIVCYAKVPDRCYAVTYKNLTSVCTRRRTVIISDRRACFAAAKERAGYRPEDLGARTGGETVFCRNLLGILHRLAFSYIISKQVDVAEECLRAGVSRGVNHLVFVHDNWMAVSGDELLVKGRKVRPPFREECLFTMSYWGTKLPSHVWPGDLRYYLCVWPNGYNTPIFLEKPAQCPVYRSFQQVPLPTYGVLFGKYKVMPWKVHRTATFAHDPEFWDELRKRVHMVVLDCSDELADKFGWGPDYRQDYTCWRDSPLSQQIGYHNLMMGASFYLGLGDTLHSPTPVEALYCRTPIIMPPYQHNLANMSVVDREFFPVESGDDVLRAVDTILSDCRVQFTQVERERRSALVLMRPGVTVVKNNSCFRNPPSLDVVMSEEVITDRMRKLIHARQILCVNKPRFVPLNDTLVNGTLVNPGGQMLDGVVNGVMVYGAMVNGTLVLANGTVLDSAEVIDGAVVMANGTTFNGTVLNITGVNGTMYGMLVNTSIAPVRLPASVPAARVGAAGGAAIHQAHEAEATSGQPNTVLEVPGTGHDAGKATSKVLASAGPGDGGGGEADQGGAAMGLR